MSTFPKRDVLGDLPEPPEREPVYDRLTVPPLSEQEPEEPEAGRCARCGATGLVWYRHGEWVCERDQCNREPKP